MKTIKKYYDLLNNVNNILNSYSSILFFDEIDNLKKIKHKCEVIIQDVIIKENDKLYCKTCKKELDIKYFTYGTKKTIFKDCIHCYVHKNSFKALKHGLYLYFKKFPNDEAIYCLENHIEKIITPDIVDLYTMLKKVDYLLNKKYNTITNFQKYNDITSILEKSINFL
jgi:hypothetical protein